MTNRRTRNAEAGARKSVRRHSAFCVPRSALKWCSHVDLHHEPPPSQGGVQNSYTLRAEKTYELRVTFYVGSRARTDSSCVKRNS